MLLSRLQHLLGGIYDVRIAHDVYDFLVTDRGRLPHAARSGVADEELLVAQPADGSDEVVMSLYLDPALLERLRREDPLRRLHAGNLADCWTALEGVSHFLYLAWNDGHDRPVSLLELEMQAEVDKYVVSYWLLRRQLPQRFPAALRVWVEVLRTSRAAVVDHLEHDALVIGGRVFPLDRGVAALIVHDLTDTPALGFGARLRWRGRDF